MDFYVQISESTGDMKLTFICFNLLTHFALLLCLRPFLERLHPFGGWRTRWGPPVVLNPPPKTTTSIFSTPRSIFGTLALFLLAKFLFLELHHTGPVSRFVRTQTPPPGKKQHRQPTAQHSTAQRRTTGHKRAKQAKTAPQNDSTARQHSTTGQRSATAHDTGKQGTTASTARHSNAQSGEDRERTARGKEHHSTQTPPPGKKTAQPMNSTTQHSTTGLRRAKQAPTAPQNDSRAQQHSTT